MLPQLIVFITGGPKEIHAWPGEWKQIANKELEDGKRLLVYHKIFEDTVKQYAVRERRYELYEGDRLVTTPNDRAVGLLGGQSASGCSPNVNMFIAALWSLSVL